MEEDYKQQREALLAHIACAARLMAKADALEKECEQKDRYIAELIAKVERIKCELGITSRIYDLYSERGRDRGRDRS